MYLGYSLFQPRHSRPYLSGSSTAALRITHPNDNGAIPGNWRSVALGRTSRSDLGDNCKLPVYGSVEKLIRPTGLISNEARMYLQLFDTGAPLELVNSSSCA